MSLEIISTTATLITAAVIAATAIAAIIQLRHLRAANQITALWAVQNELDSPDFREAEMVMREHMAKSLADPEYCRYAIALSRREWQGKSDEHFAKVRQSANFIGNTFENIGSMVKNGILDEHLVMDIYSWIVYSYWMDLSEGTAMARIASGQPSIYENFEYLAVLSKRYLEANAVTYPPNVERLEISVPPAAKPYL
jgi:hypothetical protein